VPTDETTNTNTIMRSFNNFCKEHIKTLPLLSYARY